MLPTMLESDLLSAILASTFLPILQLDITP